MSLSDSLKPKTINDLIGHKKQIAKIVKWLKNNSTKEIKPHS